MELQWCVPVVGVVENRCLLVCVRVVRAIVTRPSVSSMWPQPRNHSCQTLTVTVGDEVVGVAVCDALVVLLHSDAVDVVDCHLEEGHLPGRLHDAFPFWQRFIVGQHDRMELHRKKPHDRLKRCVGLVGAPRACAQDRHRLDRGVHW